MDDLLVQYSSEFTRRTYRRNIEALFRALGKRDPATLTEAELLAWCRGDIARVHPSTRGGMAPVPRLANNTVRTRVKAVRALLNYCRKHGVAAPDCDDSLRRLLRSFPPTYANAQGRNPTTWLTKEQAFDQLAAVPDTTTPAGLRDAIVLRLALLGLRRAEICELTWANLHTDTLSFVGKGNRPGRVPLGPTIQALLAAWADLYAAGLGHAPTSSTPLLCALKARSKSRRPDWGRPIPYESVYFIVRDAARTAGLPHTSPHGLRRSAAGILHRSTDANGAHHFDLLDIQKVLRHADPAVTMKCYLDPLDNTAQVRAAALLD